MDAFQPFNRHRNSWTVIVLESRTPKPSSMYQKRHLRASSCGRSVVKRSLQMLLPNMWSHDKQIITATMWDRQEANRQKQINIFRMLGLFFALRKPSPIGNFFFTMLFLAHAANRNSGHFTTTCRNLFVTSFQVPC